MISYDEARASVEAMAYLKPGWDEHPEDWPHNGGPAEPPSKAARQHALAAIGALEHRSVPIEYVDPDVCGGVWIAGVAGCVEVHVVCANDGVVELVWGNSGRIAGDDVAGSIVAWLRQVAQEAT